MTFRFWRRPAVSPTINGVNPDHEAVARDLIAQTRAGRIRWDRARRAGGAYAMAYGRGLVFVGAADVVKLEEMLLHCSPETVAELRAAVDAALA